MGAHSDFLAGIAGAERREHPRRNVQLEAVLLYLKKGIRGCMQQRATALNISEGGCLVTCPLPDAVSEHLYVIIAGIPGRLGCAVVGRSARHLNLRFGAKLPTDIVEGVARRRA